jgi:hypothetical protein
MSSAPPFYALSYVCGSDACSEEITIDNHVVLVKPNLFAALQELRSYFQVEHIAQITIWIDAICINQGNEDEKARQIRSMHGVFSGAVEVLAWLGAVDDNIRMVLRVFAWIDSYFELRHDLEALRKHDGEPGYLESIGEASSKAMNSHITLQSCLKVHHRVSYANLRAMAHFLSTLGGMFCDRKFFEKSGITHHEAIRFIMDAPILDAGLFPPDHVFWATIYVLSNLEWFGRVWTYQEIHLAREARLFSRGVFVHWKIVLSSMMTLLSALLYTETFVERWLGSKTKHLPPESERKESTVKWFQFQIGPPLSVSSLSVLFSLMFTKLRMSTIAKDNVYGLTALWQSKVQAEIVIDYTRETAEVFANAVKIGLKVEYDKFIHLTIADLWTTFDGFDRPRQASATEGLPSWCPDF